MNATQSFLGAESAWGSARFCLFEVQGLWGGRAIYVWGTGNSLVRRVSPAMAERRYALTLSESEVGSLLALFVAQDFVTIEVALRNGIPDESRPEILLFNAGGERRAVSKWAGQSVERFDRVYRALLPYEQMIEPATLVYAGSADWQFVPTGF